MTTGLYRVYTKGHGYVEPLKRWTFIAAFVDLGDAKGWVNILENSLHEYEDIEYKIMQNGKDVA